MDDSVCVCVCVCAWMCDLMGVHFHGLQGWMYFYTHSYDDIAVKIIMQSSYTLALSHKTSSFISVKV